MTTAIQIVLGVVIAALYIGVACVTLGLTRKKAPKPPEEVRR